MPIKINNFESNVRMIDTESSGEISESYIEKIVSLVMQRISEEQDRQQRIGEETRITNKVSKQDIFD
ncbi:MAG: hypothetical protein V3W26_03690 [Thermodesulfobacteriota bacterium]